ncbi:hypothetical protein KIN20_031995 [Parelaphostrongylus tenuis]|uniref:Uncharacterized protein n=1 Tax=Parelaphostrongylus tenuis TaxID=148309 RepID=A0AAD5R6E4_PARTN|nr:hypothetical protein KIN20_031995 [Parelaphostrongylus tenuis]
MMKIQTINDQLRIDSDEFRVMADLTWEELSKARTSNIGRLKRQVSPKEISMRFLRV